MFAGLKIYDDHLSVFQSKQLLRLKYYTISERKWRGGQTLSNFYFVIQFIIFFGNIWVSDTCCWFMNIVAQMMIELTGRGTMMKLLRLAVRRLFCLKRIEMEKNGFLYFSSFHKKNNPSDQYFTVCPKSLYLKALQTNIVKSPSFYWLHFYLYKG